jgi:hypothetical protein
MAAPAEDHMICSFSLNKAQLGGDFVAGPLKRRNIRTGPALKRCGALGRNLVEKGAVCADIVEGAAR